MNSIAKRHSSYFSVLWLVVALIAGCFQPAPPPPTPAPAATTIPTAIPTPVPTPIPTATPTPRPLMAAAPAETLVRAYFQALAAQDFDLARRLTTGQALEMTEQFASEIDRQAKALGATPSLRLDQLELGPTAMQTSSGVVRARFSMATAGRLGPFTIPGPTIKGDADFTIEQPGGELRISRFEGQMSQE